MKTTNTDYGRNKGIILSGEDTKLLDSLLASPLMRDRMPAVVRGRRNTYFIVVFPQNTGNSSFTPHKYL